MQRMLPPLFLFHPSVLPHSPTFSQPSPRAFLQEMVGSFSSSLPRSHSLSAAVWQLQFWKKENQTKQTQHHLSWHTWAPYKYLSNICLNFFLYISIKFEMVPEVLRIKHSYIFWKIQLKNLRSLTEYLFTCGGKRRERKDKTMYYQLSI